MSYCGGSDSSGGGGGGGGGVVLTAEDFPTVGVCATNLVDVTGATFKAALAAATSFTFLHKPYTTDADIPFICGTQGTWDPSDAAAFDVTKDLAMADAMADLLAGMFGHVFICNTGFGFTAGASEGFHDATAYRGELTFAANGITYRARVRFTVTGTDAGKTLASLGLTTAGVTLTDGSGTPIATVGAMRDLLAANPTAITVNAVAGGTTRITATGGFICADTQ